jgi:hypothetical protein
MRVFEEQFHDEEAKPDDGIPTPRLIKLDRKSSKGELPEKPELGTLPAQSVLPQTPITESLGLKGRKISLQLDWVVIFLSIFTVLYHISIIAGID